MNDRLRHVDIARGIAITLLVFDHSWIVFQNSLANGKLSQSLDFLMPLFFFISGLFLKTKNDFKNTIAHKVDTLLKPYFIVLTLYLAFRIITQWPLPLNVLIVGIFGYLRGIPYGTVGYMPNDFKPLWFLPHLWAVYVFSYVFIKAVGYEKKSAYIKSGFLLTLLLLGYLTITWLRKLGYYNAWLTDIKGLPLSIDIMGISAFYFLIGFTLREKIINMNTVKNNWLFLFIALAAFSSLHSFFNYTTSWDTRAYDNLLICTFEALCGIYITFAGAGLVSKNQKIGDIFAYVGSGSLFIFLFHNYIQWHLFGYLHKIILLPPYLSAFAAYPVAFCVPLLLWEIVKRNYYLSLLFLPVVPRKPQTVGVAASIQE